MVQLASDRKDEILVLQAENKQLREATGLLNSMILSGEKHSEKSKEIVKQALMEFGQKSKEEKLKETELEKAAKRCARTGNHKDLQKYLRLRRIYNGS